MKTIPAKLKKYCDEAYARTGGYTILGWTSCGEYIRIQCNLTEAVVRYNMWNWLQSVHAIL